MKIKRNELWNKIFEIEFLINKKDTGSLQIIGDYRYHLPYICITINGVYGFIKDKEAKKLYKEIGKHFGFIEGIAQ